MGERLRLPRSPTAARAPVVLLEGEVRYDTGTDEPYVGDGATTGGRALAYSDGSNLDADNIAVTPDGATEETLLATRFARSYWVEDMGALDGVADDVQVQLAINAALGDAHNSTLNLPEQEYAISAKLTLGNGSTTQYSTLNGIHIKGHPARPFLRLNSPGSPLEDIGTRFKWTGAAGGTMMEALGPISLGKIDSIALNGDGTNDAAVGFRAVSVNRSDFAGFTFAGFTSVAFDIDTIDKNLISGTTGEFDQTTDNRIGDLQMSVPAGAIGLRMDGFLGSATSGEENGGDPVRWSIDDVFALVDRSGAGGIAIDIGFADQHTFKHIHMTGSGTAGGLQRSIRMRGCATIPGGYKFPQNIRSLFTDLGQNLPVEVDDSTSVPGGGHDLGDMTMFDAQVPLGRKETRYIRGRTIMPGDFPHGGWVHQQGPVTGRCFHNKLLNPRFIRQTRGASGTITNGGFGPDGWVFSFDGSITGTWSLEDVSPGDTTASGDPIYKLRITITAASGNAYFYLAQRVREHGVRARLYNGCYVTQSAYWRQESGSAVSLLGARAEQYFGTGGSPYATAATSQNTPNGYQTNALSSSWKGVDYVYQLPSVSGKAFGSNADDRLNVIWSLPINAVCVLDMLAPQFELGMGFSVFDQRPAWWDEIECARTLRKIGAGVVGNWLSSSTSSLFTFACRFEIPMRAAPSVSYAAASAVINTPGDATYTDGGSTTASGTNLNADGCQITLSPGSTWSGGTPTAFRPGHLRTTFLYCSAE